MGMDIYQHIKKTEDPEDIEIFLAPFHDKQMFYVEGWLVHNNDRTLTTELHGEYTKKEILKRLSQ